jgi:hypothetical protein
MTQLKTTMNYKLGPNRAIRNGIDIKKMKGDAKIKLPTTG